MSQFSSTDGTAISRIGLGTTNFGKRCDAGESVAIIHAALDAGINFFDTADVYGGGTAESILAAGLRGHRDEVCIATKFGHGTRPGRAEDDHGAHPRNVIASAEASLKALETDYIDFYQLHEPDPSVDAADTLGALDELVQAGKVRFAGCCNLSAQQVAGAREAARQLGVAGYVTVQNEYSLLVRDAEDDLLPCCRAEGLGFIPYFPLASGILTGKYRMDERIPPGTRVARMKPDKLFRFFTPKALALVGELAEFGAGHSRTVLELALGYLLAEPAVLSVITGAMSPEQVRQNVAAASAPPLTGAELAFLRALPR
jgi:aryl-alcohol dehydrogenase-like predicted oxidoreductase